jgi:tetratricopeptide (TPR) repeat protein
MSRHLIVFLGLFIIITACSDNQVSPLLRVCETHFNANRLTSGRGGNALACYEDVLKKDPTNAKALAGLAKIEGRYVELAKQALRQRKLDKAKEHLAQLRQLNPNSPQLAALEAQLVDNNTFVAGKVIRDRLKF